MTESLYADLPEDRDGAPEPGVEWARELLRQSGIPVAEDELPLVAEVYREYERLAAVIDAVDIPAASAPAIALDETL